MEAVLSRLRGLSADELREEFARADLKCGPITATTRATFERKLARVLAGSESSATESDSSSSASISGSAASVADHANSVLCATSAVAPTAAATSSSPSEAASEELDFGYGMGLNPPEEEEILVKATSNCSAEGSNFQSKTETPSKPAQVSPTFYYGVCPLWEDVLARNERAHVYTDKKDALQAVKMMKGARFKAFPNREDAEKFAKGICDYFPSPNKSTPCVSPVKPGLVISKDNMEVDTINRERANSFKSPRTQDLTAKLRKAVEKGDEVAFSELVWSNPRYLIGSGDNPTIVQEGCRYNVMHVAAKENQAGIAQLLLDTLENPEFMRLMYPDDQEVMLQKRIRYIVDLYLNTPDKAGFETPLHFACKFGCPDVVDVLCSHPDIEKNCKNKDGQRPCDLICSRKNKTQEVKQKIIDYLEDRCFIPLLRATDNTSQPIIGAPWSPESSESLSLIQRHTRSPMDPLMTVTAFAGPLSPSKAKDFRRFWKTPPRDRANVFHDILKSDPDRGAERVGRDLAHEMGHPWAEYWDFLDSFVDLSSTEGLRKLEEYLSKRDFSPRAHEEAGENETSNRFKSPSPGKPKKFCNSISVGAFLDEGDDISLEEMKNRQNAALTSITSSAASKDGLKGAVGGREFHILPIALHHRGADLIETAAEQDLLCCCDDGLLSPGVVCKNGVCSSSRDRTHNGDKVSPRTSPSSSCLSPISNLMVEFERMSLQEPLDSPTSCRERRSSGGSRHRDVRDSYSSSSATDLSSGLNRLSLGHSSQDGEALEGPSWRTEGGGAEERRSSGSSEEYFEAEESLEVLGRTRGSVTGGRNFCARSKSWDHGGRDLSSSGSSGSSYKSLDNSHEFLPRTPPHIRRGLFIDGDSPTKLDREVLSAIEGIDVDPQKYPSIHKWKSTMTSYSASDMQSWPSPVVVKPRLRMQHQTPGSPVSGLMSPTGRFSPARHAASPDFSPSRYSPANASYIQRIRLKHLNEPPI
ncbi:ankyrin repeat and LEM domain-containing protein 2 isoform X1 [Lates calcarifer]|uniref:Ankyrin repeat and LEM domain-containing protein 2 n=1 Tax=Lates calcarifer TaxID=8187 RepID=A0AAJ8DTZ0_LATCA|nr:ankyrin repeat and LEM domain-containing protein 2 isoform X1 [Lates calcarifer]XP_050930999.1 ankyrin repeat and LEM domain-containing protein 2 isoform X1 [Lates calcarifer]XP_050931000.1 ankyrin repeat and LEM domain-containing protein 2 isoform X1 [Lates calcarifer]XP_050931001.1 ankyrin repeat and LEM domain-containing protein 2 isoform X1 [Lates calcarifer]XP_050931002.1 ankyrin repeat and LEM domain-containing protein 2 isoform X1 [Lates calcarifer]XP_050931003.1 ankyrin repeat and L